MAVILRPAEDADSPRIVEIVGACFALYPGCVFDVDREMPELRRLAGEYRALGGEAWVAEEDARVLGCVAWKPCPTGVYELQRLYVDPAQQGRGLGRQLSELAIVAARDAEASALELWTDTRFEAAHRLYERLGFRRAAMTRSLDDLSCSVEFLYRLPLAARWNGMSPKREN